MPIDLGDSKQLEIRGFDDDSYFILYYWGLYIIYSNETKFIAYIATSIHCTLYSVYCALHSVQCTVQCTVHTVRCIIYDTSYIT